MAKLAKALSAAAGNAAGDPVYVEDVFSTYLYTGNDGTQTITTGIDVSGEGGLIWQKPRTSDSTNNDHKLFDTARGQNKVVYSNLSAGEDSGRPLSYTSTGFTLDAGSSSYGLNKASVEYTSWTFRKQKGFFDVKKVTKSSGSNLVVDFSDLGSLGFVVAKYLGSQDWLVWCKGMTSTHHLKLNQTDASSSGNYMTIGATSVTLIDGAFSSGDSVIYAWADGADSSAQIFGDDGDEPIIKCGSYTTDGSGNATVNLGFEPQWILSKRTNATGSWYIRDVMRGMPVDGNNQLLIPNSSGAETGSSFALRPSSTGFTAFNDAATQTNAYVAIRRGPMKEPSAGTDVFQAIATSGDNPNTTTATFPWDTQFNTFTNTNYATYNNQINDRLRGFGFVGSWSATPHLTTANTDAQTVSNSFLALKNNGMDVDKSTGWGASSTTIFYNFRRYPKVFDVVCYAGAGGNADVTHNLGVAPEMMIVKARDKSEGWAVQAYPALSLVSRVGFLNATSPFSGNSQFNGAPTATVFKVGNSGNTNESGYNYVAYLFATLAGISKVGSYTGTGNTLNVDCGFSGGARFVMIKRADAGAGPDNWFVFDSVRGISVGNDPWFAMNSTAAQVTTNDYISTYASGFTVSATTASGINENYGDYIFLAFA